MNECYNRILTSVDQIKSKAHFIIFYLTHLFHWSIKRESIIESAFNIIIRTKNQISIMFNIRLKLKDIKSKDI